MDSNNPKIKNLGFTKGLPFVVSFKYLPDGVLRVCRTTDKIKRLNEQLPWHHEFISYYRGKSTGKRPFQVHLCSKKSGFKLFLAGSSSRKTLGKTIAAGFGAKKRYVLVYDPWLSLSLSLISIRDFYGSTRDWIEDKKALISQTQFQPALLAHKLCGDGANTVLLKTFKRLPKAYLKELSELETVFSKVI